MPLDKNIKKVLVIGSGPIVIGQAAEFDYAGAQALSIGSLEKPETVAHRLFNVLRQMDEEGVEALTCEVLPAEGIGLAIMNRRLPHPQRRRGGRPPSCPYCGGRRMMTSVPRPIAV